MKLLKFWTFFFKKPDYNVSDHSEKYFSFLVYGEMPSSAAVGQNYSFTVDVDLSGTVFSFQQDVTSSDAAVPQAVCILYASRSRTMMTNVVHLFICCMITGFPLFFFTARKSNSKSVAVFFYGSSRWPRNN